MQGLNLLPPSLMMKWFRTSFDTVEGSFPMRAPISEKLVLSRSAFSISIRSLNVRCAFFAITVPSCLPLPLSPTVRFSIRKRIEIDKGLCPLNPEVYRFGFPMGRQKRTTPLKMSSHRNSGWRSGRSSALPYPPSRESAYIISVALMVFNSSKPCLHK